MKIKHSKAFISYSHKDKEFVSKLVSDLASMGAKVWLDLIEMKVGDSMIQKIQDGIEDSEWLVVILSPDSVESTWVKKEFNAALMKELEKESVYVLPLLYRKCKIPSMLREKVYADFTTSYEEGLQSLADRLAPEIDVSIINGLMSDDNYTVKMSLAMLSERSRNKYLNIIKSKLASDSDEERKAAITALYFMNKSTLRQYLIGLATDPSVYVARSAIFYIGELKMKEAISIVSQKMSDGTPHIRAAARDTFKKISV